MLKVCLSDSVFVLSCILNIADIEYSSTCIMIMMITFEKSIPIFR